MQSDGASTLRWALVLLPFVAFGNIRGAALRGMSKAIQGQLPEQFVKPVSMILMLSLFLFMGKELTAELAMQLNVVSAILAFLIGAWLLWTILPPSVKRARPAYSNGAWFRSLLPMSMVGGMRLLDSQVIVLLLGSLASIDNVGLFKVATQGAGLVSFGLVAVNLVLSPYVTRLFQEGKTSELQHLATIGTRMAFGIAFPVALILIVFGKTLINWVFGSEYTAASLPLTILCLGQLINAAAGSVGMILNMAGYERETFKAISVALPVSIILTLVLVPPFGVTGAAIASSTSLVVWTLYMMLSVQRYIGLKTFVFKSSLK